MQTLLYSRSRGARTRIACAALTVVACSSLVMGQVPVQKDISRVGWSVAYLGGSYDAVADVSVHFYVLAVADWEQPLEHWTLAIPNAGEWAKGPQSGFGLDPVTGLVGHTWTVSQPPGQMGFYALCVPGNPPVGTTFFGACGGGYYAIGQTWGPVPPATSRTVGGILFLDANRNQAPDDDEPRLGNVSVELWDAAGQRLAVALSDGQGAYVFEGVAEGDCVVHVPAGTAAPDLNEIVSRYLMPRRPMPLAVAVAGEDSLANHLGYEVDVQAVLLDFDGADPDGNGCVFAGVGYGIGFWKHQNRVAAGGKGTAQVAQADLLEHLRQVGSLHLPEPFRFAEGREHADALAVFGPPSGNPVALLCRQLLATELNHVAGWGLDGEMRPLQDVLIAWAENLVCHHGRVAREELLTAAQICERINGLGHGPRSPDQGDILNLDI
ncbi:MAG: hypothetical protein JXQ71_08850 [Verrucomicrobia bacterium]|nr:hypothetical protein [Verrucomicrobiota bacterium]